jgi:hypothetical protein
MMRILVTLLLLALATACSHPLEIVGQGDILSASGDRDCRLEDYQAAADNCTENLVETSYQETYYALPRAGWQFDRWENYCEDQAEASCSFDVPESAVMQAIGQTAPALRAIFVAQDVPNKSCNGGFCTVYVLPGIEVEAAGEDIENLANGKFKVAGDAQIYTPDGGVILAEADLVIEPGVGMTGTSLSPDYAIGRLAGSPPTILPRRVNVETLPGTDVNLEVPVYADTYYVVFTLDGLLDIDIDFDLGVGNLQLPLPTGVDSWRMILDPVDPFIYVGVDQSLPIVSINVNGFGPDVTDIGSGYGVSLGGRIPFKPSVPPAIQEVLPEVQGDSIYYGSLDLTSWLAFLEARLEGVIITDEDPDENGAYVFGSSAATSRDRLRASTGTFTPNFSIPLMLGLVFDLNVAGEEPLPFTLVTSRTGMGTDSERREAWFSFDLPSLAPVEEAASGWLTMPGERAASVFYFGPEEGDNFFRGASESAVEIDAERMAGIHGVSASALAVEQTIYEINASGLSFSSESFIESFHADVTYTASSSFSLRLPLSSDAEFDLQIQSESEIGGVALRGYGKHLTETSFRHWGEYVTPNYGYRLEGAFSEEGAWLEGSADVRLPYRYAAVEQIADIAGQIAATEEAERIAEADYAVNLQRLRDYQALLEQESAALEDERAALRTAQNWLAQKRDELDDMQNYDCGSCKWYQATCLAEVAACVVWREAAVPVIEGAVALAQGAVNIAQAGVNRLQASYDEVALLVAGAQRAVDLALDARDEARLALIALRAEREALPLEDGTVDVHVALRLTRGGLTGTVSGTFQGVAFGDGVVINDANGSSACFIVPQTGEELCTAL